MTRPPPSSTPLPSTPPSRSAGATAITATTGNGFTTWSADTSGVTLADGQSYTITVTTTDSATPTGTSDTNDANRPLSFATTAPTSTVISPSATQFRSDLPTV